MLEMNGSTVDNWNPLKDFVKFDGLGLINDFSNSYT